MNDLPKIPSKSRSHKNKNRVWGREVDSQVKEITAIQDMHGIVCEKEIVEDADNHAVSNIPGKELPIQKNELCHLCHDAGKQQKQLPQECDSKTVDKYGIDAVFGQDVLRARIKAIEKNYSDLKCNFIKYMAAIL